MKLHWLPWGLTILCVFNVAASADEGVNYNFGVSCSSQGGWTAKAINLNHTIIHTIEMLKSNAQKECQGIETLIPMIRDQEALITNLGGADDVAASTKNAFNQDSALMDFVQSSPDTQLVSNAKNKMIDQSLRLGSQFSQGLDAAKVRQIRLAADYFGQVVGNLSKYSACIQGRDNQGAALLSGLVNMAAAYSAVNGQISKSISSIMDPLIKLAGKQKFATAAATETRAEYWNSMSCMIEMTSESYCSVKDAQRILKRTGSPRPSKYVSTANFQWEKLPIDEPLAGYYILARHVPNLTRWVQDLQFGVPAKWMSDGNFKADAEALTSNFKQTSFKLPARLQDDLKTYDTLKTNDAKRNFIVTMTQNLVSYMAGSANGQSTNFYFQTVNPIRMPFYLLDLGDPPSVIFASDNGGPGQDWSSYVQKNNFSAYAQFNNPDQFRQVLVNNVQKLNDEATQKASAYYMSRIIVNKIALIVKAVVGQPYNVLASFVYTRNYLTNLEKFFTAQDRISPETSLKIEITAIHDTIYRLDKVIGAFQSIEQLLPNQPLYDTDAAALSAKTLDVYTRAVEAIYTDLDVLWQKDGYVQASLQNFVMADYGLRVRRHLGFGRYEAEYLTVSGQDLLDVLGEIHALDANRVERDFNAAMSLNKASLNAVETLFFDPITVEIEELNAIISKSGVNDRILNKKILTRQVRDSKTYGGAQEDPWHVMQIAGILGGPAAKYALQGILHPDLYPYHTAVTRVVRMQQDDEDRNYFKLRNKLCIQTLSFENRARFFSGDPRRPGLCDGVILTSPYADGMPANKYLNADYKSLLQNTSSPTYQTDNICAYRNFLRRNTVYWMSRDQLLPE